MDEFGKLLEKAEKELEKGKVVKGKVVKLANNKAYIDIGYKIEGVLNLEEIPSLKEGDEVEAIVVKLPNRLDNPILSVKPLLSNKAFLELKEAKENKKVLKGKVERSVKGGFLVSINGIKGFLPFEESTRKIKEGEEIEFNILELELDGKNIRVKLSQKALIEEKRKKEIEEMLERIKEGEILEGKILKVDKKKGITVALKNNLRGFIPINEISWSKQPKDIEKEFLIGQKIELKVINKSKDKEFLILSIKRLKPHPWDTIDSKYKVGDLVEGTIYQAIKGKGVFIELEDGINALIPESEIDKSFIKNIKRGAKVEVIITKLDKSKKQIDAKPYKKQQEKPWEDFIKTNPPGSKVKGKVKNIEQSIAFVELAPNVEGIIKKQDLSWSKINKVEDIIQEKEEREFVVLSLEGKKIRLGIKQLQENPWEIVPRKYKIGDKLKLKVKDVMSFGAFLGLEEGIDGLLPISEIPKNKKIEKGQELEVKIIDINPKEERITFSLLENEHQEKKEKDKETENEEVIKTSDSSSGFRLGDIIKSRWK